MYVCFIHAKSYGESQIVNYRGHRSHSDLAIPALLSRGSLFTGSSDITPGADIGKCPPPRFSSPLLNIYAKMTYLFYPSSNAVAVSTVFKNDRELCCTV